MNSFLFLFQYVVQPRTVGAVWPSSKYLAQKMIHHIDFENADYIVEYGPGTGVFTDQIIENRSGNTSIMLIERNQEFYRLLKEKYKGEQNLFIIHGSADEVEKYVSKYGFPYIDYVVSGLPFASLPKCVSNDILIKTKQLLGSHGKFVAFQYTRYKLKMIHQYFQRIEVKREFRNTPPACVFTCSNE
ncbi:SAM-dependent methyltransferase [Lederbergia sp. NSJ-179]|uniref:class I SAM-dependent methyltransferase n=1 Tax=Lederbergia sp. NSJ-179 TaxID=2931402 RepID=UPI001FD1FD93|nr:rRNA adenine N-6-methyltransferase family protein [Lederbergia sp. NSJ-179]MCJ7841470.1 SAM-dependent methyltransferase [Lederbergia sp. NSJ-179]